MAATEGKGITMGEVVIFDDGTATILGGEFTEPQDVVIYCDLCNEPVAITPEANDQVFVTCLRCHAVSDIKIQTSKEPDEPTES
jgi:hypothetical protein